MRRRTKTRSVDNHTEEFSRFLDQERAHLRHYAKLGRYNGADTFVDLMIGATYKTPEEYQEWIESLMDRIEAREFEAIGYMLYTQIYLDFVHMYQVGHWEDTE